MRNRLQRIYIETSAVNALKEKLDWGDAVATKAHLNMKGKGWYLSPVVLWEIMATKNEEEREALIFFAQHLFEDVLLPSPEELIVSYIAKGFPLVERGHALASAGDIAKTWKRICEVKQKTLVYSQEDHSKITQIIREFGSRFNEYYSHTSLDPNKKSDGASLQAAMLDQVRRFNVVGRDMLNEPESARIIGLTAFFILIILCGGGGLDRKTVDSYWASVGITTPEERIEYAFTELKPLFIRGPILLMASMCAVQAGAKSNRGMIFDCMHSVYAVYSDMFLSADNHFRELREHVLKQKGPRLRIRMLDEVSFTSELRVVPPPDPFIVGG